MNSDDAPTIGLAETHVSQVFFTGDRAYKLLKPIATAFLDHSGVEQRLNAATREIELNRRLAPDVYIGHADVVEGGENGTVVDRFIVMRRLPAERKLARLIDDPHFAEHVRDVVKRVASFHSSLDPVLDSTGPASADFLDHLWTSSLDEMERDADEMGRRDEHDEIRRLATNYVRGRRGFFATRIAGGFQRDGHGDLLADDIFSMDDGPRILDCLAFRDDLRIGDVLNDIAFLAMDIERLGRSDVATAAIDLYAEFTNEHHPTSLAHHYIAYRALVRSKVSALKAAQGQDDQRLESLRLHQIALEHLRSGEVRAVMVGGAPGTGKSTTARAVADRLGWMVVSSDEVRKERAGVPYSQHLAAQPDDGAYSPANVDEVYRSMLDRAKSLIERGESVVLDASWTSAHQRQMCLDTLEPTRTPISALECVLDAEIATQRIERRRATGADDQASDATPGVAALLAQRRDPWPDAAALDTNHDPDEVADRAAHLVRSTRRA